MLSVVFQIRFLLFATLLSFLALTGCLGAGRVEMTATLVTAPASTSVVQLTVSADIEATVTVAPSAVTSLTAAPTAIPVQEDVVTPTPEPVPTHEAIVDWEGEQLIALHADGIYRMRLDTDAVEPILSTGEEWELFSARFSSDGTAAVYWFLENDSFEVWMLDTVTGETKQLISIAAGDLPRVSGSLHGRDRFFELALWGEDEYGVPLVVQWYLLDTVQNEIVGTAADRPGMRVCHTLAVSPKSHHVATWCSFDSQFEEQQRYTVVEADGEAWQTEEAPEEVLAITYELGEQIWSPDWSRVLIPIPSNATIVNVREPGVEQLLDEKDVYLHPYSAMFSPDGQLLSYRHDVCETVDDKVFSCLKIVDLESRAVVWESTNLYPEPAYMDTWSPDGEFFILSTREGSYILRRRDFSVVRPVPIELGKTGLVWLDQ